MKAYYQLLKCIFFHGKYHVVRMVPLDRLGGVTAYRLTTLCTRCDAAILQALDCEVTYEECD